MLNQVAVLTLMAVNGYAIHSDAVLMQNPIYSQPAAKKNVAQTGTAVDGARNEDGGTWIVLLHGKGVAERNDPLLPDGGEMLPQGGLLQGGVAVAALLLGARAATALSDKRGCQAAEAAECLPFSNPWLLLELAGSADHGGCGERYLCELFGGHGGEPMELELRLISFVRRLPNHGPSAAALQLRAAALDGLSPASPTDPCASHRQGCRYSRDQLLEAAMQIIS